MGSIIDWRTSTSVVEVELCQDDLDRLLKGEKIVVCEHGGETKAGYPFVVLRKE